MDIREQNNLDIERIESFFEMLQKDYGYRLYKNMYSDTVIESPFKFLRLAYIKDMDENNRIRFIIDTNYFLKSVEMKNSRREPLYIDDAIEAIKNDVNFVIDKTKEHISELNLEKLK